MIKKYIFPFRKLKYLQGKKPEVKCILCSSIKNDPKVTSLMIGESENLAVSINLYPYNTAHLMIFPKRHLTDIRELSEQEASEMHKVTTKLISILEKLYNCQSFTVGYNLGENSGASIAHIHQHIIPRYANELGVIDLVGGAKVIIEEPRITQQKIQKELKDDDLISLVSHLK